MEQHAENRVTHESLMEELVEGERNNANSAVDYEIPDIPEALKTPEILETFRMLQLAQEVNYFRTSFKSQ